MNKNGITDEDKKRLSKQDQERITAATAKWEQAAAAGDEAGKKAAADEAAQIRANAGYYTDSYGRYQGNLNQSSKNEQIISTSEQKAMDKAFNEGFYGTDDSVFTTVSPISPNKPSTRNTQQNDNPYKGDPFLEGLYGIESSAQNNTVFNKNNANQHPWQTDDDHYAFMEGLMGEDYVKELQTNNKNTTQSKQEKYSNTANNKNNSVGSDTGKKTVRGEGLHYLPNGGTDSYGRQLPAGSYIRVQNGTEYVVLPNDPRIKERIEAEYKAQEAAKQQSQKKSSLEDGLYYFPNGTVDSYGRELPAGTYIRMQNGVEYIVLPNDPRIKERIEAEYQAQEAAKQPQQSAPQNNSSTAGANAQSNSQQAQAPDEDEDWENAFSGSDSEEKIELPNNIFGEDEIDTSDYDSFIDYVEENGLYYDFYIDYNEQGEKVRFAELYDSETGERLATLQEGRDFFYAQDGVFFTKDFTYNSRGRKILEMRAGIYEGDDARELFESLGYEISISGNTIYLTDETGKTLTFARGEEFSATKNGIFIAPGALSSKIIQELIKNNPKSRIKEQVLDYAERILRADGDITQKDMDYLAANMGLLEGDKKVEAALEELFNDEEFAAAWDERLKELEALENPQTEEDEATAVEMVFATVLQFTLGYTHETGNKVFDSALKLVSFGLMLSPIGKFQNIVKGTIGKAVLKKALVWAANQFAKKEMRVNVERKIMQFVAAVGLGDKIYKGFDDIVTFIYGAYNIFDIPLPKGMEDFLSELYDMLGMELEAEVLK